MHVHMRRSRKFQSNINFQCFTDAKSLICQTWKNKIKISPVQVSEENNSHTLFNFCWPWPVCCFLHRDLKHSCKTITLAPSAQFMLPNHCIPNEIGCYGHKINKGLESLTYKTMHNAYVRVRLDTVRSLWKFEIN